MDFVIGHPRSGTMLASRLINACGLDVAQHELLPALTWSAVHEPTEYYAGQLDDRAIHNLLDIYSVRPRPETRIDCCWKLSYVLPPLVAHFPNAKIVHLTRDPRTNVRACYALAYCSKLHEHPAYQTDPQRNHWLRWTPEIRRPDWSDWSDLEKNCAFWDETHRLILAMLENHPRAFRIKLEDMGDLDALAELYDFLELPRPSRQSVVETLERRVNDMSDAEVETARLRGFSVRPFSDWSAEDRAALERLCGQTAEQLGYDQY